MRVLSFLVVAGLFLAGFGFAHVAATPANDDVAISDVMKEVMKGGLLKKAMSDKATDEEKLKVLDMFISLTENEPPKGDIDEWKAQTQLVLTDYAKFLVGREGAAAALKESTNCKACHDKFKGE